MKKILIYPAIAIALISLTNCNKEYDPGPAPEETAGNYTLDGAFATLMVQPKIVTIDAAAGGTFNGNSGTRYEIPPSAFVTSTGAVVTGNVDITVAEYTNKADMLFSGVLPVGGDEPLLSGGEVLVEPMQAGQPLQMAAGKPFKANLPMPGTDATGMTLFTGTRSNGRIDWKPVEPGLGPDNAIAWIGDTVGITSTFAGYANADRFMTNPNYQKFTVVVNSGSPSFNRDSFLVFAVYDKYNAVWPIKGNNGTGANYNEYHVPDIPVHFVAFGVIKGNFYGGMFGATPQTGKTYTVNVTKMTPQQAKDLVRTL